MRTTLELPDPLFREVKAIAANRGISLKEFFTEATRSFLRVPGDTCKMTSPPVDRRFAPIPAKSNLETQAILEGEDIMKA
jgi:hypothetical protein